MAVDISVDEIKVKFQKLQSEAQKLKEEKVRYEAQLSTLKEQYDSQLQELLKDTGAGSLPEAVEILKNKQEELNSLKENLQSTLDKYLGTVDKSNSFDDIGSALL